MMYEYTNLHETQVKGFTLYYKHTPIFDPIKSGIVYCGRIPQRLPVYYVYTASDLYHLISEISTGIIRFQNLTYVKTNQKPTKLILLVGKE